MDPFVLQLYSTSWRAPIKVTTGGSIASGTIRALTRKYERYISWTHLGCGQNVHLNNWIAYEIDSSHIMFSSQKFLQKRNDWPKEIAKKVSPVIQLSPWMLSKICDDRA